MSVDRSMALCRLSARKAQFSPSISRNNISDFRGFSEIYMLILGGIANVQNVSTFVTLRKMSNVYKLTI